MHVIAETNSDLKYDFDLICVVRLKSDLWIMNQDFRLFFQTIIFQ